MDQVHRVGYAHRIRFTFHRENSGHPLPQRLSAVTRRVVLASRSPEAGTSERVRASHVARSASPNQIRGRVVFFMAVHMAYFDVSARAAQTAAARAKRWCGVRAIPQRSIRDSFLSRVSTQIPAGVIACVRVLLNPAGPRQSWSSSLSSSSSSESSSPRRMSSALPTASAKSSRLDSGAYASSRRSIARSIWS